jgi:Domain of unknown function (DUF4397)
MKTLVRLITVLGLVGAMACGGDDEGGAAQLRVIHASPDAPAVDIYARGVTTPLFQNVSYGQATAATEVEAGDYTIDIRAAGAAATSEPVYSVGPLTLAADSKVAAVATGLLASTDAADRFRVVALVDGFSPVASGKARLRILHAGADAPAVGIDLGDDGEVELTSLSRFADTGAAGIEVPADTALQVGIRAGGDRVTAFTTPALTSGSTYTIVATGLLAKLPREADGFVLVAVPSTGAAASIKQNPVVYALHGSPDAPAVDVFAGTTELVDDIAFGELSAAIQVPPGTYTLDFFAHAEGSTRPAGAAAASTPTPALASGGRYLAIANGFLSPAEDEPAFTLVAVADDFALTAPPKVRVVHASPDAPAVDVGTSEAGVLTPIPALAGLSWKSASGDVGTDVPVGNLTIGVAGAGSTASLAQFSVVTANGARVFAIALGAYTARPDIDEPFGLYLIDTAVSPWQIQAATSVPLP